MKTLFIVSEWVPFPESEYGGMHVVVAASEDEAVDLLMGRAGHRIRKHRDRCVACVKDSTKIAVSDSEPSRVVRSFTT